MLVKGWRNDESRISPTASEQEIDTAIKIIITMYFFATGSYITELESAGHDVEKKCSLRYTVPKVKITIVVLLPPTVAIIIKLKFPTPK